MLINRSICSSNWRSSYRVRSGEIVNLIICLSLIFTKVIKRISVVRSTAQRCSFYEVQRSSIWYGVSFSIIIKIGSHILNLRSSILFDMMFRSFQFGSFVNESINQRVSVVLPLTGNIALLSFHYMSPFLINIADCTFGSEVVLFFMMMNPLQIVAFVLNRRREILLIASSKSFIIKVYYVLLVWSFDFIYLRL